MKKLLLVSLFLCLMLLGNNLSSKVEAETIISETTSDFYSLRNTRSQLDSRMIDGERYYFILDELQLLVFDENLTFVKRIGHVITGEYNFEVIADIDHKGNSDILFIIDPQNYSGSISGPSLVTYSFETGKLLWSKYLTIEELFTKLELIFYVEDYQIENNVMIVSFGHAVERLNLLDGNSIFKKQFNNNIWSVSYINDTNNDGTNEIVINQQPNRVMILNGLNGEILKEKNIGTPMSFDEGDLNPNIWRLRYNDSADSIGVVTEDGMFYELDTNLNQIHHYQLFLLDQFKISNIDGFKRFINQGYTDRTSAFTYKNIDLILSEDLDGDNRKDFVMIYKTTDLDWFKRIAVYNTKNKQTNYEDQFDVIRYFDSGHVLVQLPNRENQGRDILDLKTGLMQSTILYTDKGWTNNKLTLTTTQTYLQLYKGNDLVNKAVIDNKETYKISKYLYGYDEYGAKNFRNSYHYDSPHMTKEFIQYDEAMDERFKFKVVDNEWIYDFNPIDKNENLIFIHTGDENGEHRIRLFEVGKEEPLKDYSFTDSNWDDTITVIPLFDLNGSNDYLLKITGVSNKNNEKSTGSIFIRDLNSGEEIQLDDIIIDNFVAGDLERVDIHYDLETSKIEAFIFERFDTVIKLKMSQGSSDITYGTYDTDIFTVENVEQISDLDGDGWNDYQVLESGSFFNQSTLILTGENDLIIKSKKDEIFYQSDVDFNEDGINDFIGTIGSNNKVTYVIYTYDSNLNQLIPYWSLEKYVNDNLLYQYKAITALNEDTVVFYHYRTNGDVELHKVNIKSNSTTVIKLFNDYRRGNSNIPSKMIYSQGEYIFFEYNHKIYTIKDEQLISVIKGDHIHSYYNTLLVEDKEWHNLYMSDINEIKNNITYKTLFNDNLDIKLSSEGFTLSRIMTYDIWKELETTQKELHYVVDKIKNIVIVETFDEYGNMNIEVFIINKVSPLIKLAGIGAIALVLLIITKLIKKGGSK